MFLCVILSIMFIFLSLFLMIFKQNFGVVFKTGIWQAHCFVCLLEQLIDILRESCEKIQLCIRLAND